MGSLPVDIPGSVLCYPTLSCPGVDWRRLLAILLSPAQVDGLLSNPLKKMAQPIMASGRKMDLKMPDASHFERRRHPAEKDVWVKVFLVWLVHRV